MHLFQAIRSLSAPDERSLLHVDSVGNIRLDRIWALPIRATDRHKRSRQITAEIAGDRTAGRATLPLGSRAAVAGGSAGDRRRRTPVSQGGCTRCSMSSLSVVQCKRETKRVPKMISAPSRHLAVAQEDVVGVRRVFSAHGAPMVEHRPPFP